jgi:hypothetical protein
MLFQDELKIDACARKTLTAARPLIFAERLGKAKMYFLLLRRILYTSQFFGLRPVSCRAPASTLHPATTRAASSRVHFEHSTKTMPEMQCHAMFREATDKKNPTHVDFGIRRQRKHSELRILLVKSFDRNGLVTSEL